MLPVAAAMPVPATTPTVCATATIPPIRPRRATGTWSGTIAVTAASIALSEACTPHQPTTIHQHAVGGGQERQRERAAEGAADDPRQPAARPAASSGPRTRRRPGCRSPT